MSHKAAPLESLVRKQNAKLVLVVQNFFAKALQIIVQARSVPDPTVVDYDDGSHNSKVNKWFNLHTANASSEWLRQELRLWKSQQDIALLPSLVLETYLDLRLLSAREIVTLKDDNGNSWPVADGASKQKEVVVERWLIEFDSTAVLRVPLDDLPLIYKQAIVLLRVIYGFIRLQPAFKLKKLVAKLASKSLAMGNRISDSKQTISSKGRVGLSKSIIPHQMLLTESHLTQRAFTPIETSLGTLRVSVVYRNHHTFKVQDHEERLSDHFLISDKEKAEELKSVHSDSGSAMASYASASVSATESHSGNNSGNNSGSAFGAHDSTEKKLNRSSFSNFQEKYSVLPCTSEHHDKEFSPAPRTSSKPKMVAIAPTVSYGSTTRPGISPFKVGSISNSPPPQGQNPGSLPGSSMERRISITSNRTGSNASLVALLRTARGSNSSSNTPNTIAISNPPGNNLIFPRSVSSSHGSHLQSDENIGDNISSTPRFSSSFGSRQGRRLSSNSGRFASTPTNDANTSLLGTSFELQSSHAPLSGLYVDDGISDFVRMIDDKRDLRLSSSNQVNKEGGSRNNSSSHIDALDRFQLLKSQHQQFGDSVNASMIFHNATGSREIHGSGSKPSSRKSSQSRYSPPPSGSYDNSHLPSISSRLHEGEHTSVSPKAGSPRGFFGNKGSFGGTNVSYLKSSSNKLVSSPLTATTMAHATRASEIGSQSGVSGLATSPSVYTGAKRPIEYEDVFEDDDDGSEYFGGRERAKGASPRGQRNDLSYDNDDLLFEMTDTR